MTDPQHLATLYRPPRPVKGIDLLFFYFGSPASSTPSLIWSYISVSFSIFLLLEDSDGLLTLSAVYLPPKHRMKQEQLEQIYNSLGHRFIAGGDFNAKHTDWGSRLITPRGREVLKTMENNLKHPSSGEPTYLPTDRNKLPDIVDFCHKRYSSKLRYSQITFRSILRSLSSLGHTSTCEEPRTTTIFKQ
jgi:hypothetical protein